MVKVQITKKIFFAAVLFAFAVVMMGAYTRLADAGLGCPDWPGCYGHIGVPKNEQAVAAQALYPEVLIEPAKAWKEMIHRYIAGCLGIFILSVATGALWQRRMDRSYPVILPLVLLGLVCGQAALGMWTVTLKLHPLVVMGHLLGGFSVATLLAVVTYKRFLCGAVCPEDRRLWFGAVLAIGMIAMQIILGGWTSANYASAVCFDFPTCQGHWWYAGHLSEVFHGFLPIGANYEGGVMSLGARMTLQLIHRYWGLMTFAYVFIWSMVLMLAGQAKTQKMLGLGLLLGISLQVLLGIFNVILQLPMANAVLHNGVALVVLMLAVLSFVSMPPRSKEGLS